MDGVRKFVASIVASHPDARCEVKRVFADGDHVILHSDWHGLSGNAAGEAVVDIFRLEDGKVVEHWDVIQPVPRLRPTPTPCSEPSSEFRMRLRELREKPIVPMPV